MNGDDPAREIAIGDLAKARVAKDVAEPLLIGKRADRRGQIFVDAGGVPRHSCANPRKQLE